MTIAERVRQYRIESLRQTHRAKSAWSALTVLLHPTDDDIESNIAILHTPLSDAPEKLG